MQKFIEALAESAWRRLRDQVLSTQKFEQFVKLPAGRLMPEKTESGKTGLFDPGTVEDLARDILLLNLSIAIDPVNVKILKAMLGSTGGAGARDIASSCRIPELAARERLSLLQQCGWAVKDYDTGSYHLTPEGTEVIQVLDRAMTSLADKIRKHLPELMGTQEAQP